VTLTRTPYRELVRLERRSTFAFHRTHWLRRRPHLLTSEEREAAQSAKHCGRSRVRSPQTACLARAPDRRKER
jgi:hypothetical protein